MKVALIGFGEVGQVLGLGLMAAEIKAYDRQFGQSRSEPARRVASSRCEGAASAAAAVSEARVVISAVTVDQAVEAAESVHAALKPDTWYLDLNSASPEVRRRQAELIGASGGRYVEAAVMAPINPRGLDAPILLGGDHATEFQTVAQALGFTATRVYAKELGQASAAKLCRSVVIKGFESLLTESLVAARYFGVEQTVLESLRGFPGDKDFDEVATYQLSRTVKHGARRAAEMRQAAETVAQSGTKPTMAAACAAKQEWAAGYHAALEAVSLDAMLDVLGKNQKSER